VSPTYEPPFTFTGILKKVTVEAKGPEIHPISATSTLGN
jgi:hypothetical protein